MEGRRNHCRNHCSLTGPNLETLHDRSRDRHDPNAAARRGKQSSPRLKHPRSLLGGRPDVAPVFLIHDLLPLDFPEFFPRGYELRFLRRVETMAQYARAIITTTAQVAERIQNEYRSRGLAPGQSTSNRWHHHWNTSARSKKRMRRSSAGFRISSQSPQ